MIRGIHGLFYSSDAEATRAFFKDIVKLPGSDIGQGWWIFDFAEGDMGVHAVEDDSDAGNHDISFYCDDIHGTVEELKSRGVKFSQEVEDHGYGLVTYFSAPGGITVQLYEARYTKGTKAQSQPTPPSNLQRPEQSRARAAPAPKTKVTKKTKAKPAAKKATRATTAKKAAKPAIKKKR